MKTISKIAYLSAAALVSFGFAACSSDPEENVNPTFDGESVKTAFTLNLTGNVGTRQAGDVAQQSGFRGIDNIKVLPYTISPAGDVVVGSTMNANYLTLAPFADFFASSSNSKVYADVTLQVGTTNFLFYGKAKDKVLDEAITAVSDKFTYGTLDVAGLSNPASVDLSAVKFSPVSIYDGSLDNKGLLDALNAVANIPPATALSDGNSPAFKDVTAAQSSTISAMADKFKTLTTYSSHSVQAVFEDMYMNLDNLVTATAAATAPDANKLAVAIRTAIATYCDVTESAGVTSSVTLKTAYTGFPANENLPDGAVRVTWDGSTKTFKAVSSMDYGTVSTNLNVATLDKYVYPANLQYFVNSPLKVSNNTESQNYGSKNWATILTDQYTAGTAVTALTRSVAITNPIQYGVGRLETTVKLDAPSALKDADNADVTLPSGGYPLTGVLIGGQKEVDWAFKPNAAADEYTIYDRDVVAGIAAASTSVSGPNYTLALETAAGTAVYVALELTNAGADFKGADGIIPAGGKFYLVGKLEPSEGTGYVSGTLDQVFKQDYTTKANFTIKADGLKNATNGIPDLRTPQLELGLSVDLTWETGLVFNPQI